MAASSIWRSGALAAALDQKMPFARAISMAAHTAALSTTRKFAEARGSDGDARHGVTRPPSCRIAPR